MLEAELATVSKQVGDISKDLFLANTDDQLIDFVYSNMAINPLVIYRDGKSLTEFQESRKEQIDRISGRRYAVQVITTTFSIPFTGESELWVMEPSQSTFNPPKGDYSTEKVNDQAGTLRFKMEFQQGQISKDVLNDEIERNLKSIEDYIEWMKKDIDSHNLRLRSRIKQDVVQRREMIGKMQNVLETINIPITQRNSAPFLSHLPLQRKLLQPLSSQNKRSIEYTISDDDYQNILRIIRHEGGSYERTPIPFSKHDEEELRDILMSHLNGHYEGLASSEAFRKKGKTDICIESKNRAAFVAECKIWKGEQEIKEAVTQLMGYLTWRDCKTSLIVFNKNVAGFKKIQEKLPTVFKHHPNFVKEEEVQYSGEWRFVFRSSEDPDRLIVLHTFLFNLFVSKETLDR